MTTKTKKINIIKKDVKIKKDLTETITDKTRQILNEIEQNPDLLENKEVGGEVIKIFEKFITQEINRKTEYSNEIKEHNIRHLLKRTKAINDLVSLYEGKIDYVELVLDKNYLSKRSQINRGMTDIEYSSIFIKKTSLLSTVADLVAYADIQNTAKLRVTRLHQEAYGEHIPPEYASFKKICEDVALFTHFVKKLCYFFDAGEGEYRDLTGHKFEVNQLAINDYLILSDLIEQILSLEIPRNTYKENLSSFLA
jgi:hypothetical protein